MSRRNHPRRTPAGSRSDAHAAASTGSAVRAGVRTRIALFLGLAAIAAVAVVLVWPRPVANRPSDAVDQMLEVTMGGFSTPVLAARAGAPLRVFVVNPDSQFHTDGGGWHQVAIPELGVDARIAPRSSTVVEIPAAEPGEYTFYCDVCCGGKENPSMQGVLRVRA